MLYEVITQEIAISERESLEKMSSGENSPVNELFIRPEDSGLLTGGVGSHREADHARLRSRHLPRLAAREAGDLSHARGRRHHPLRRQGAAPEEPRLELLPRPGARREDSGDGRAGGVV